VSLKKTFLGYLAKMETLPFLLNADLSICYTGHQVAEKYGWLASMEWSISLRGNDGHERIRELNWGLGTHIMHSLVSLELFETGVISAMIKKKILGGTSLYVIILKSGTQRADPVKEKT